MRQLSAALAIFPGRRAAIDRGTMTIAPSDAIRRSEAFLYRSSVLRKLFAYAVSHREQVHQKVLGVPVARVLLLTTKPAEPKKCERPPKRLSRSRSACLPASYSSARWKVMIL